MEFLSWKKPGFWKWPKIHLDAAERWGNTRGTGAVIGMLHNFFYLGADKYTQKFRISLSVSDTVVSTGLEQHHEVHPLTPSTCLVSKC